MKKPSLQQRLRATVEVDKEKILEEEILASFERGEWQPSSKGKGEIARFAAIASVSLAEDKR